MRKSQALDQEWVSKLKEALLWCAPQVKTVEIDGRSSSLCSRVSDVVVLRRRSA